ncbi:MAG: hypothetical protein AAGF11_01675 [Myxococcota bacterium]
MSDHNTNPDAIAKKTTESVALSNNVSPPTSESQPNTPPKNPQHMHPDLLGGAQGGSRRPPPSNESSSRTPVPEKPQDRGAPFLRRPIVQFSILGSLAASVWGIVNLLFSPTVGSGDFGRQALGGLLSSPFYFVREILVVNVALVSFWGFRKWRAKGEYEQISDGEHVLPEPIALRIATDRIISSHHFLRVLRDTLPRSSRPEDAALSHVPYILGRLNNAHERAEKDAGRFLGITIVVGLIFSIVISYYGYILVNDDGAGIGRKTAQLQETSEDLADGLLKIQPSLLRRKDADEIKASIRKLLETHPTQEHLSLHEEIKDELKTIDTRFESSANDVQILALEFERLAVHPEHPNFAPLENEYTTAYSETESKVRKWTDAFSESQSRVSRQIAAIDSLIPDIRKSLDAPSESKVPELIKRALVGLIVASFFLALLRYAAGLYGNARQRRDALVEREVEVRRFCVALLAASGDEATNRIVEEFTNKQAHASKMPMTMLHETASQNSEIIKELLSILGKKIN